MFAFFSQIADVISTAVHWFVFSWQLVFNFLGYIGTAVTFIVDVSTLLPAPVIGGCLAMLAADIVYLILGR